MGLFLKIVLAVVLVLAVLAVGAILWLRRWVKRSVADSMAAADLIDPRHHRPARIRLISSSQQEPGEALQAAWTEWHGLGFRQLGDHGEYNGAFTRIRLAAHPVHGLALVLAEDPQERPVSVVLGLTGDRRLLASAAGLGPALHSATFDWLPADGESPAPRVDSLRSRLADARVRQLDDGALKSVFERAYAVVSDADIATGPPTEAELRSGPQAVALAGDGQSLIDLALRTGVAQWHQRVEAAVLDNWRRASRIDAVTWERLADDVHVVYASIDEGTLRMLACSDEQSTHIFEQLLAQGLSGVELYEEVQKRLPPQERRERVGEVRRPIPAIVFAPGEAASGDPGARAHGYEAVDSDGRTVRGAVLALGVADARQQLASAGLTEARIVTEPAPGHVDSPLVLDPELARRAVSSLRESAGRAVLRSLLSSAWIWAPPAVLLAWTLRDGAPYGWGDWIIFGYAALAGLAMFVLVAPMILYNQLLRARLLGQWPLATMWLAVLKLRILSGALTAAQLTAERCKILAGSGRGAEALRLWATLEPHLPADQYYSELAQIHDAAGDCDAMIDAQRRVLELSEPADMARVDLAMSLVRFQRAADEAEVLLTLVPEENLSELALSGYHYAQGLILAERSQHSAALSRYQLAIDRSSGYRSMPLVSALIAEINGYAALSLRAAGERDRADALWRSVLPLLKTNASNRGLLERYEDGAAHVTG